MIKRFIVNRTKKDSAGRKWEYCDGWGSWTHGRYTIGCGGRNKNKWMIWDAPCEDPYVRREFDTLTAAMEYCYKVLEVREPSK